MDDRDRWNDRYRDQAERLADEGSDGGVRVPDGRFDPPEALTALAPHLPGGGTALDLAGGTGGAALAYARAGLRPVLVDVSDVALTAAQERSAEDGVDLITVQLDMTPLSLATVLHAVRAAGGLDPITVVSCFHYLDRDLLASVTAELPSGAVFLAAVATVTNLERNERPSARFLLERGELRELVVGPSAAGQAGLEVLHWSEGWNGGGLHEATLAVRKP